MIELDDDTLQAIREGWLPDRIADRPDPFREALRNADFAIAPGAFDAPARSRRKRKPSLDKLIAKAKALGATSVIVDGVEMRFGESSTALAASAPDWKL
jgi:hypothetical protein